MKILITEPLDVKVINAFVKKHPEMIINQRTNFSLKTLKDQIEVGKDCSGMIVRSQTRVTRDLIKHLPKLKIVISACSGSDKIDKKALRDSKVKYLNLPNGNYESTAEHILCMLMALAKNLILANNSLKDGCWGKDKYVSQQITGKKLGIIGLGKVGTCLAQKASGLGLKIIAYDPYLKSSQNKEVGLVKFETILRQSDYVCLCVPLTPKTNSLISQRELNLMKPSSFLINCSRGQVIDEGALYAACKRDQIKGVALDVFKNEPKINKKLCSLANIVVTPHIAGQTNESLERNSKIALSKIIKYIKDS